ncbi:37359_t:CDS:1, partial [Gigaspora margarita]
GQSTKDSQTWNELTTAVISETHLAHPTGQQDNQQRMTKSRVDTEVPKGNYSLTPVINDLLLKSNPECQNAGTADNPKATTYKITN